MQITLFSQNISDHITNFTESKKNRSESVTYTLSGFAKVDRIGGYKSTISLTFGEIKLSEWDEILSQLQETPAVINITRADGTNTALSMVLSGEVPMPYVYTKGSADYIVGATVTMEQL